MVNTSISLSKHWRDFIAEQVASGRCGSASEVIRDGLRLAEARARQIEQLDAALQKGIDSGIAGPFDLDRIKKLARQKTNRAGEWNRLQPRG